ncbi:MAG: hypothetical protein JW763_01560 [candidate division Zixibacteria bacterium]|nr:hypothetical protein [candidate division Zixibacteria bacterium]
MTKKLITIFMVVVLLVSAVPQKPQSHIILQALAQLTKFLLGYAAAKGLDRILFGEQLTDVEQNIIREEKYVRQIVYTEDREQLLQIFREAMTIVNDLRQRVADNETSTEELQGYCKSILENRVTPLEKQVYWHEMRINALEEGLDSTNRRVDTVMAGVNTLGIRMDNADQARAEIEGDVFEQGQEIKSMKSKILFSAVVGGYYRGFRYRLNEWGERYSFLPFTLDSSRVYHAAEASFGFWINKMVYMEGAYHFVPERKSIIHVDGDEHDCRLAVEGGGWSAMCLVTFPTTETLCLELGAGVVGNSYKITYSTLEKDTEAVIEEHLHRTNNADFVCIGGLRLGENGVFFIGDAELLYDGSDYRGLYFRFGFQKIL